MFNIDFNRTNQKEIRSMIKVLNDTYPNNLDLKESDCGHPAIVLELPKGYVYWQFAIKYSSHKLTMNTRIFNSNLDELSNNNENFNTIGLALNSIVSILRTVDKQTKPF